MLVSESGTRSGLGSFIKAGWAWLCSSAISSGAALLICVRNAPTCSRGRCERAGARARLDEPGACPLAPPRAANDGALADESRRGCVAQGRRRSGPLFARSLARSCLALEQLAAKQRSCSWIVAVIFDTLTSSRSRQPCPERKVLPPRPLPLRHPLCAGRRAGGLVLRSLPQSADVSWASRPSGGSPTTGGSRGPCRRASPRARGPTAASLGMSVAWQQFTAPRSLDEIRSALRGRPTLSKQCAKRRGARKARRATRLKEPRALEQAMNPRRVRDCPP